MNNSYNKTTKTLLVNVFVMLIISGCSFGEDKTQENKPSSSNQQALSESQNLEQQDEPQEQKLTKKVDFSEIGARYRFFAEIPEKYQVEYIEQIDAVNIYNPESRAASNLQKSEVFIRNFSANSFLTLNTVIIHSREETEIKGKNTVIYDIEKKESVPDFANQPIWRSQRHFVTDIRETENNPSTFFVFARKPENEEMFQDFLNSLQFENSSKEASENIENNFVTPMTEPQNRALLKPFGIYITRQNSPVSPERFAGYHTGYDFEPTEQEQNTDAEVRAACAGELLRKSTASGYGGYAVQRCVYNEQPITVVYGHIDIGSIKQNVGDILNKGEFLAVLGSDKSTETDGERKHLHFGVHKGSEINILGYVQSEDQLASWLDPKEVIGF